MPIRAKLTKSGRLTSDATWARSLNGGAQRLKRKYSADEILLTQMEARLPQ
jgi:hypothetical protein